MKMAKTKKITPAATVTSTRKATKAAQAPKAKARGIEKKFLKTRPVCKVTFTLPKEPPPRPSRCASWGSSTTGPPTPIHDASDERRFSSPSISRKAALTASATHRRLKFENDWKADRYESNLRWRGLRRRGLTGRRSWPTHRGPPLSPGALDPGERDGGGGWGHLLGWLSRVVCGRWRSDAWRMVDDPRR